MVFKIGLCDLCVSFVSLLLSVYVCLCVSSLKCLCVFMCLFSLSRGRVFCVSNEVSHVKCLFRLISGHSFTVGKLLIEHPRPRRSSCVSRLKCLWVFMSLLCLSRGPSVLEYFCVSPEVSMSMSTKFNVDESCLSTLERKTYFVRESHWRGSARQITSRNLINLANDIS